MYQKYRLYHICFIFSILVCLFFSSPPLLSQTVSPGTVTIGGMDISSEITNGVSYAGKREIRPDLRIASEKWTETLPNGTINQDVKPPESEVYTYTVNARGQGRIDLTLNDSAISYDVGGFRSQEVAPTSLTVNRQFRCYSRKKCTVIRSYTNGYVADYYDTCIPIANEGSQSEVIQGTEPLEATASVTPWEINVVYGTEKQVNKTLGFTGGWPPNVGVNAGWGETNTQKWGWQLRETQNKASTATPFNGSFTVTLNDTNVSASSEAVPVTGCVTCPNCNGSVNHEDDHVRRVLSNGKEVLAICPLGAGGTAAGCGKKIYDCTPEETAKQDAWHQERTCQNNSHFSMGNLIKEGPCGVQFRHCTQSDCGYRYKWGRGHSDGSVSQVPSGATNQYAESHLIDDPPTTATLTHVNSSNTVNAGGSYTVTLSVPSGYSTIYWYIKPEGQAGTGTSQSTTTGGSSSTTTASYTYSIPSGVSGNYVLTAYTYLPNNTIVQPTHTVSVRAQPTTPSHPLSVSASPGPSRWSVSLSWTAPSSDGGSAITGYEYQYRRYYADTWESWSSWQSVSSTSTTVTGLISNGTYEFRLRAVNSVGTGSITDSVSTTAN